MKRKNLVLVPIDKIQISNHQLDIKKMLEIKASFDWHKFGVIPVYPKANGQYIITDGNHRVSALRNLIKPGMKIYIPAVLLTRKEYDYVKHSDRNLDIMAVVPKTPQVMN